MGDSTAHTPKTVLAAAIRYAGKGKPVFPCGQDKQPLTPHGFHDATTNQDQIRAWWVKHPDAMIGMPTGEKSGFTDLDVDLDPTKAIDGNDTLHKLERKHGKLPDTPEALTPRGGRHIYFNYVPGIRNSAGKLGEGLDIRGEGGYVIVPPSMNGAGSYHWEGSNPDAVADMPQWMIGLLRAKEVPKGVTSDGAAVLEGGRNAYLTSQAGSMRRRGLSVEAMEAALLAENTTRCDPPLDSSEVSIIAKSVGRYKPTAVPSGLGASSPSVGAETQPAPTDNAPPDWRTLLICKDDDLTPVKNSHNNAGVFMAWHPEMLNVFAFNEFTQAIDVLSKPPWRGVHDKIPRKLQDVDVTLATSWLETKGVFVSPTTTYSAIDVAANHHKYDPLKDWLKALVWDGEPRLTGWLARLYGAEASRYTDVIGRKFLIGAVARGFDPGCKMDTMLVLEGVQGILKSTGVEVQFGEHWFTDEIHSIGSKDAAMQLQGNWAVEIPEMHAMSRAESNQIKEWITRRADKYRPPYGKCVIESLRRCVLIGTLNPDVGYLKDPTGARRFWPVRCFKVDIDAIRNEREQIFAEAVVAYRAGEAWWLETRDDEQMAKEHQGDRYESDPWADAINMYIAMKTRVATPDIMAYALELKPRDCTKAVETRIGKHMTSEGWKRKRITAPGSARRQWVYEKVGK